MQFTPLQPPPTHFSPPPTFSPQALFSLEWKQGSFPPECTWQESYKAAVCFTNTDSGHQHQILLCPTRWKGHVHLVHLQELDSTVTFFSFWRCRNETKKYVLERENNERWGPDSLERHEEFPYPLLLPEKSYTESKTEVNCFFQDLPMLLLECGVCCNRCLI